MTTCFFFKSRVPVGNIYSSIYCSNNACRNNFDWVIISPTFEYTRPCLVHIDASTYVSYGRDVTFIQHDGKEGFIVHTLHAFVILSSLRKVESAGVYM